MTFKFPLIIAALIIQFGLIITSKEMVHHEPVSGLNEHQMAFSREEDTVPYAILNAEGNRTYCGLNHQDTGKSAGLQQNIKASNEFSRSAKRAEKTEEEKYTIELAVFVDIYQRDKWLSPGVNETYITELVFEITNETQEVLKHPTLKADIGIVVVKVEVLQDSLVTPDDKMRVGYRTNMNSFRRWLYKRNDRNWDHAMLITGYTNCAENNGVVDCNFLIAGTSYLREMCSRIYSVSLIEGSVSGGVVAHELAHNLGASHDVDVKDCPTDDSYVMSNAGKAYQWSSCSSDAIRSFLNSKYSACLKTRRNLDT